VNALVAPSRGSSRRPLRAGPSRLRAPLRVKRPSKQRSHRTKRKIQSASLRSTPETELGEPRCVSVLVSGHPLAIRLEIPQSFPGS